MAEGLSAIWAVLSETPAEGIDSLVVSPAATLDDGREILAGLDTMGNRHVLVPLRASDQFGDAGSGAALQLRLVEVAGKRFASAVSTDRRLDDVFAQFAKELVESVVASGKPGRDMRLAFGRWRALFAPSPVGRLTKAEEIGLLGELLTLKALLEAGGSVAVWEGPSKALHDFRREVCHVEVKATLAREGLRISIHGVDQLSVGDGEELHLLVYRFSESATGQSLIDVIRAAELNVDDLVMFERKLKQSGFEWAWAHDYKTKYDFEVLCFNVLETGFPRITPKSFVGSGMPLGTMQLTYVADLSGASPVPVGATEMDRVIRSIAGEP